MDPVSFLSQRFLRELTHPKFVEPRISNIYLSKAYAVSINGVVLVLQEHCIHEIVEMSERVHNGSMFIIFLPMQLYTNLVKQKSRQS